MKKIFTLVVLVGAFTCSAETITRGPYLQLLTPNSVVVRWRTDQPTSSVVWFGAEGARTRSSHALRSAPEKEASKGAALLKSAMRKHKGKKDSEHIVRLTDLTASTRYSYAIELEDGTLLTNANFYFITPPPVGTAQPIRFWVLGDPGTRTTNQVAVRDAYLKFSADRHTDGWLMLGDNAYSHGTDKEYQGAVFGMYSNMLSRSCLWPTLGNHDARSANSDEQSGVYYDIFTLPTHGEAGGFPSGTEAYYSFDYGNVHFVCLDSSDLDRSPKGRMLKWLKDDLKANKQTWCVAYFHHPPYTKGSHDSDRDHFKPNDPESGKRLKEMRENALPVLEAGGADLVITGHSHSYERSFLIDGHYGFSETFGSRHTKNRGDGRIDGNGAYVKSTVGPGANEGTVHIVAGSSGKITGGKLDHPAMFISRNELGSLVLDFNTNRLDVTFLGTKGQKIDYFTMIKGRTK